MTKYSEKQIENYLIGEVRIRLKGTAFKFTSPGRRAVPDRLCVICGHCFFVECKATDKYLTDAQKRERDRLINLKQWVYVVNSKLQIDQIIHFWGDKLRREGHI